MKKLFALILGLMLATGILFAQPWVYDFGTETRSFPSTGYTNSTFLPQPTSGEDYVKVGSGGGIYLNNPGLDDFGSDSELRIVAASSGNMNKFSVYDYSSFVRFYIKFDIRFGDSVGGNTANSGKFYFVQGHGNTFSSEKNYDPAQSFTVLSFEFGDNGSITTKHRSDTSIINLLTSSPITQGTNNTIEIWGNNSSVNSTFTYYRNGISYTLRQNMQDIWINGIRNSSIPKASIKDGIAIDSFMFDGEGSTNNVANCFIDNIVYSYDLYSSPSTQATINSSPISSYDSATLNWSNGNGSKRVVLLSTHSDIIPPQDGTDPEANSVFNSRGQQVVYNGTGNSVTVTGLSPSTTYYAKVFEVQGSGLTTMYNTTGTSTQFITQEETLPVELTNFNAHLDYRNRIRLQWVTQSEANLLGYYIYRNCADNFSSAKVVSPLIGATNTSQQQIYAFTDETINAGGIYYYWLQSIDYNASENIFGPSIYKFELPETGVGVEIPLQEGIRSVYPNPCNPATTINYELEGAETVQLSIYNLKGQRVVDKTFEHSGKGSYNYFWNGCDERGKECATGIYNVIMRCGERIYIRKLTLLK